MSLDLHADDSGTRRRDARLCSHRRGAFGDLRGFSSEAIADRNNDAKAKLVITSDGGWRRGSALPLKTQGDAALQMSPTVENCIVVKRLASRRT